MNDDRGGGRALQRRPFQQALRLLRQAQRERMELRTKVRVVCLGISAAIVFSATVGLDGVARTAVAAGAALIPIILNWVKPEPKDMSDALRTKAILSALSVCGAMALFLFAAREVVNPNPPLSQDNVIAVVSEAGEGSVDAGPWVAAALRTLGGFDSAQCGYQANALVIIDPSEDRKSVV